MRNPHARRFRFTVNRYSVYFNFMTVRYCSRDTSSEVTAVFCRMEPVHHVLRCHKNHR